MSKTGSMAGSYPWPPGQSLGLTNWKFVTTEPWDRLSACHVKNRVDGGVLPIVAGSMTGLTNWKFVTTEPWDRLSACHVKNRVDGGVSPIVAGSMTGTDKLEVCHHGAVG
jgi:uncharacterized protein (DUF2237 family)